MNAHNRSLYQRPAEGTATERVWRIADAITAEAGRKARRKEVIDAYTAEGGNPNTASTQYYHWSQFEAEPPVQRRDSDSATRSCGPLQLWIDAAGRLAIPPDCLSALELDPEGRLTAQIVDGELHLISPRVALRKLRAMARSLAPEGYSVVDEFIAEKRREAERE